MVYLTQLDWLLVQSRLLLGSDEHPLHLYLSVLFICLSLFEIMFFEDERIILNVFLFLKDIGEHVKGFLGSWSRTFIRICNVAACIR